MVYEYVVYTSIPRNFDPDVEGVTLDSIVGSCDGILDHTVPGCIGNTVIRLTLDRPLNKEYLIGQLNDNFGYEGNVVLRIDKKE